MDDNVSLAGFLGKRTRKQILKDLREKEESEKRVSFEKPSEKSKWFLQ